MQSAKLVREPDNPYDPNAVRVVLSGEHIGYVPKSVAEHLAPAMDGGERVRIVNTEIGKFQGVWYAALVIAGEADCDDSD